MYDVIIIGGGPSGMMAAISCNVNKKVLLLDKNSKLGKKLEITGGGRCNLLNLKETSKFIEEIPVNSKFLYSILNKCSASDLYKFFTSKGIKLKKEDNDRIFPISDKSNTIIDCLINEMLLKKVDIKVKEEVKCITLHEDCKEITTNKGNYKCKSIIIATGGVSYPHTGSTGDGYVFAKEFGHTITKLYPAETFLITKEKYPLSGISLDNVKLKLNKKIINGSILFTHQGLSGPGILKISEYVYKELLVTKDVSLIIDFLPNKSAEELMNDLNNYDSKREVISFVREYLPKRLADFIVEEYIGNSQLANCTKQNKIKLIEVIKAFKVIIKSTGRLESSFVTGGGIHLKEINPQTLESKIVSGIYFVGEVLDIHGPIGGYNITIALATGYVAGKNI